MSQDATVDVLVQSDGSFEIPCVHPSPSYGLCVVWRGERSCTNVSGPDARGLRISRRIRGVRASDFEWKQRRRRKPLGWKHLHTLAELAPNVEALPPHLLLTIDASQTEG